MLGADLDFFIFGGDGVVKSIAAVPMSSPFLPAAAWAGSSFLRFGGGGDFVMDAVLFCWCSILQAALSMESLLLRFGFRGEGVLVTDAVCIFCGGGGGVLSADPLVGCSGYSGKFVFFVFDL